MKGNRKFRQVRKDDSAVSEVFGAILLLVISASLLVIGNMYTTANMNVARANVDFTNGFVSWLNNQTFSHGNNNSTTPYVEYEFNSTTQQWDFWYCVGHEQPWVKLTPDIKTQQNYTLDIIITGKGTVTKQPMLLSYKPGTPVLLNATQNVGWCFIHWAQDFNSTENPATIIMNSNKVVYAVFQFINT